jgi:hypothetical protein
VIPLTGKKQPKPSPKSKANRRKQDAGFGSKKKNRQVRKPKRR